MPSVFETPLIHKFTIPGRLPGLNEIVNAARGNRFAGASQKKKETRRCGEAVIAGGVLPIREPITIRCDWHEPNGRRDVDNISAGLKFIADALVETGRIPDDRQEWIRGLSHTFQVDKVNPRVEVTLFPVG